MTVAERSTQRTTTAARWWHIVTLVVILASVVTQLVLVIQGKDVLPIEEGGPGSAGEGVLRFFSYYTIQSNLLVAAAAVTLIADPWCDGSGWRVLRYASLIGITPTGIIYWTVLHWDLELSGVREATNYGLHAAAPVLGFFGWLFFGPRPRIDWRTIGLVLIWPVAWLIYILVLGAATGWYPYPFVDVDEHGYGTVTVNVLVITMFFLAFSWFMKWLDGRLPPRPSHADDAFMRTTIDDVAK